MICKESRNKNTQLLKVINGLDIRKDKHKETLKLVNHVIFKNKNVIKCLRVLVARIKCCNMQLTRFLSERRKLR